MDAETRTLVRERAESRCEYCRLHQDDDPFFTFHIEHVIPKQHGGTDTSENLALSCFHCNLHKGPNLTGIDPHSGKIAPLFNPRKQTWKRHFRWNEVFLEGRTQSGRATVVVLAMNAPERIALREALINSGQPLLDN